MAAKIKQNLGAEPTLIAGSGGIYDVVVDNELVYSKSQTHTFPDEDQLINELISTYGSKK